MTRSLRFVGVANAAVWFGAAIFYTLAAAPALGSADVKTLLGQSFPYYSGALSQVLLTRYLHLQLACSIVALIHLIAESLYLGHSLQRAWTYLLGVMFGIAFLGTVLIGPNLREFHRGQYLQNATAAQRQTAAKAFQFWHTVFQSLNVFIIVGTGAYLWRAANPPDELRFVGSAKMRG